MLNLLLGARPFYLSCSIEGNLL